MKRFHFARPIRDESCESTRIATISHPQLLPSASRLPVRRFDFATPIRDESCESTRTATVSHPQLLPSASRLPVRRFDFATTIRDESGESTRIVKNSHPSYCLLRVDFQGNDSTLQETFPTNRVASLSASPNRPKFVATFLERQTFIYHYFTGIDFRWCGSTPNLVPRVSHLTAPWSERRGR